ncbi:unnamed protein product [Mesocestoides corti]|uniref:Secreted protein n=1 Tax=Mesocestoides corti TaxID=53468 RepID=A0A0R3U6I2_MESCO|nr:unnamed protein product [Mesocestoides corti]
MHLFSHAVFLLLVFLGYRRQHMSSPGVVRCPVLDPDTSCLAQHRSFDNWRPRRDHVAQPGSPRALTRRPHAA